MILAQNLKFLIEDISELSKYFFKRSKNSGPYGPGDSFNAAKC